MDMMKVMKNMSFGAAVHSFLFLLVCPATLQVCPAQQQQIDGVDWLGSS